MLPIILAAITLVVCIPCMQISYRTNRNILVVIIASLIMLLSQILVYVLSEIFVIPFALLGIYSLIYVTVRYTWKTLAYYLLMLLISIIMVIVFFIYCKSNSPKPQVESTQITFEVLADSSYDSTNYKKVVYVKQKEPVFKLYYRLEIGTFDRHAIPARKTRLHFINESEPSYLVQTTTTKYYWNNNVDPAIKTFISTTVEYDLYIPKSVLLDYPN